MDVGLLQACVAVQISDRQSVCVLCAATRGLCECAYTAAPSRGCRQSDVGCHWLLALVT